MYFFVVYFLVVFGIRIAFLLRKMVGAFRIVVLVLSIAAAV